MESMMKIWIPLMLLLSSCSGFSVKNKIPSPKLNSKDQVLKSRDTKKGSVPKVDKGKTIRATTTLTRFDLKVKSQKAKVSALADRQIQVAPQLNTQSQKTKTSNLSDSQIHIQAAPQSKKLKVQTTPLSIEKIATQELALDQQKKLLSDMQSAYDQALAKDFIKLYQKLKTVKNLDPSIAGQGHYLAGLFFYATKFYGSSIQSFDSMLDIQGLNNSDKVKALFGKAQTFKKMNIPERSVELYQEIIEKYPSSHEASRAAVELQKVRSDF
jgi:TolA-binding protein